MKSTAGSKAIAVIGWILTALVVLFLTFDGVTKVIKERHVIEASHRLGLPVERTPVIGVILLCCVAVYVVPRTAVLGAILLTGYLGGAVATHVRAESSMFETIFPVIFGIFVWLGIYLRDSRLRTLVPVRK